MHWKNISSNLTNPLDGNYHLSKRDQSIFSKKETLNFAFWPCDFFIIVIASITQQNFLCIFVSQNILILLFTEHFKDWPCHLLEENKSFTNSLIPAGAHLKFSFLPLQSRGIHQARKAAFSIQSKCSPSVMAIKNSICFQHFCLEQTTV